MTVVNPQRARTRYACTLPLLLVVMPFLSAATAAQVTSSDAKSQGQFELILEADRSDLVLGEPIYLTARLRNVGSTWATVDPALSPETHRVAVYFTDPNGQAHRFLPLFYADATVPARRLAPGDEASAVFPVFFGSFGWSLPEAGSVQVHLTASTGGDPNAVTVASNRLTLNVSYESPLGDRLVDGSAPSLQAGKFMLWHQGDHLLEGRATVEKIAREAPNSVLADYARLALGRSLARSFRDFTKDRLRPPDCIAALDWLNEVRAKHLPRYLKIQRALSVASCHAHLGDEDLAMRFKDKAERLSRGRSEFDWIMGRVNH